MGVFDTFPYTNFHELNQDWMIKTIKDLLAEWAEAKTTIDNYTAVVIEFRDFVTNYFDNLDVQQEINNKLDAMEESGELYKIMLPFLREETASQNQRISVLESRMDTFASLPDGSLSTAADAELADIRTGANGTVYPNAGDAVRGQIENVERQTRYLGVIGSYQFNRSTGHGGEIAKLYPDYGNTYTIEYSNPSNVDSLDFYEFYTDNTNRRIKHINSPTAAGTYTYTPTSDTVEYLRIYAAYTEGSTCAVDVIAAETTFEADWQGIFGIDKDPKYYEKKDVTASSGQEMTKLYPESGKTYLIYAYGLANSVLDLYEFDAGGSYVRVARLDGNKSYHYIPSSNVDYLRLYLKITDNTQVMSGKAAILDYDSIMSVPIKENASDAIATDYLLSKEFAAVQKFTVIGDSLSSGYYKESSNGAQYPRNIPYSWPQIMAKMYGTIAQNASKSGATCATWWEDSDNSCKACVRADNRSQVYIMALGTNDYKDISDDNITAAQIGSAADINAADYTQNADSFWGNYCKILQYVHEIAPQAKIICLTIPQPRPNTAWKQTAIREICAYSLFTGYVALCDLEANYNDLSNSPAMQAEMWQGHFTPVGYANSAEFLMYALSKTIQSNRDKFINLPLIPFDRDVTEDGIISVLNANASDAVDITTASTYITVLAGKYVTIGSYVYFNILIKYERTTATGINNLFNLPAPVYDKLEYPEYGESGITDNVLNHANGWRIVGPHSVGAVRRIFGKYKAV